MNEGTTTAEPRTFSQVALGIAGSVSPRERGGPMSRGDRAELRRMKPGDAFYPEAFWRLVDRYDISPAAEPFWTDVIPLMVDHPHNANLSPGLALARARVSAPRVERWLRLDAERARREARRLLTRLTEGLNWAEFAQLLYRWDDPGRRRFARDFFLSPEQRERRTTKTKENA